MGTWKLLDIPLMDYDEARALQLGLVEAKKDSSFPDWVLLLEHPEVFTVGRRGDLRGLKVAEEFLRAKGVELKMVERGGLITYHGPGQLVCYPVVDLRANGWKVLDFVWALEEVMIRSVRQWGILAERNPLNRGVWVGMEKLGSLGIAVRRGISFHGFALNVSTELEPFGWIDPCGLKGVGVTSMIRILGVPVEMAQVRSVVKEVLADVLGVRLLESSWGEIRSLLGKILPTARPPRERSHGRG